MMETVRLLDVCKAYQPKTIAVKALSNEGRYPVYGANGIIGQHTDYNHSEEEVLMGCRGSCGAVHISQPYSWINGNAMVIQPNGNYPILKKYLYYCLLAARKDSVITGTAQPQITRRSLCDFKIQVCPPEQQQRIVAKIEELFSELDNSVAALKQTKTQLSVYRQAVLKDAFNLFFEEGYGELEDIIEDLRIGPFGTMLHKSDYVTAGIPIINPQHIKSGKILPSTKNSIHPQKANELSSYRLKTNDIIMGRRGEMGRCAAVKEKENGWICGTGSLIIRLKEHFDATLYAQILSSPMVILYLEQNATGTTMKNINEEIVKSIPIPILNQKAQARMLQKISTVATISDNIESTIDKTLQQAESLRQSILKQAFEGKLV